MAIVITPAVANIGESITVSLPENCRCRVQLCLEKDTLTDGAFEEKAQILLQPYIWLPRITSCADTRDLPDAQAPWVLVEIYDEQGQYKETVEKRFDVVVPQKYAPDIDWFFFPQNDLSQVLDPVYADFYFQGVTRVRAQTYVHCHEGASVKSVTMEAEGKTYQSATEELVSDVLTGMGKIPVKITATDTRGLSVSYTDYVTVTPYARPVAVLGEQGVFRCDEKGNPDPGGTYLYVHAAATVFPLSGENQAGLSCRVTPVGMTPGAFSPIERGIVPGAVLLPEDNYLVELLPYDSVCQGNILSVTVPKQAVYAHQTDDSLALGMYRDQGGLEVAWPARFYDTLTIGSATLTEEALEKLLDLIT